MSEKRLPDSIIQLTGTDESACIDLTPKDSFSVTASNCSGVALSNLKVDPMFCSYCKESLLSEDKMCNEIAMQLTDDETVRLICVKCLIKAFDKLLGEKNGQKTMRETQLG